MAVETSLFTNLQSHSYFLLFFFINVNGIIIADLYFLHTNGYIDWKDPSKIWKGHGESPRDRAPALLVGAVDLTSRPSSTWLSFMETSRLEDTSVRNTGEKPLSVTRVFPLSNSSTSLSNPTSKLSTDWKRERGRERRQRQRDRQTHRETEIERVANR